jgi:hypothetical protein
MKWISLVVHRGGGGGGGGGGKNAYGIFWGTPERKISLGNSKRGWNNDIKMDYRESGKGRMDLIHLGKDRHQLRTLVDKRMNCLVP